MRASEFLIEGATDVLYHYTSTINAFNVLESGTFKLSSITGNPSEEMYAPPGYPYFFSTARSKVGDYHRYAGSSAVMFVLDGQWLQSRFKVKPIDYWDRAWIHSSDRTREAEDRVFSKKPEISIDCVTEIHVLLKEQTDPRSQMTRRILIAAKKRGIPAYLYIDEDAWRLQNKAKSVSVSQAKEFLKGPEAKGRFRRPLRGIRGYGRSSLLDWIELIKKKPGQELTKSADKLRYNIQWYGDQIDVLANDMSNARKPNEPEHALAVKINDFLTKNNMSLRELYDFIKNKWKKS